MPTPNNEQTSVWLRRPSIVELDALCRNSMVGHVGIRFTEVGDDFIVATMPVDSRTVQPFGILHGGASAVLSETLASAGGAFCVDDTRYRVVGLEINVNHIRSVTDGRVTGTAKPIHLGRRTQVWEITVTSADGKTVAVSRLTLAVVEIP